MRGRPTDLHLGLKALVRQEIAEIFRPIRMLAKGPRHRRGPKRAQRIDEPKKLVSGVTRHRS